MFTQRWYKQKNILLTAIHLCSVADEMPKQLNGSHVLRMQVGAWYRAYSGHVTSAAPPPPPPPGPTAKLPQLRNSWEKGRERLRGVRNAYSILKEPPPLR